MKTGIVILNYNDSETTIKMLERIKSYQILDSIVIVDNNSEDDSYKKLSSFENDKIKIIKSEQNNGYGYGNNLGCKHLIQKGVDYIIISNPDVIFEEEDIKKLIRRFDDNTAIVAPIIDENNILNRGWKYPSVFIDGMSNINYIGRRFKKKLLYGDEHYISTYSKVDVVSGCFFIINRSIFEKVDGFDENTFLYYEESILSKKIKKIGKDILIDNNVKIIHEHSVSIDKSFNKIKKFKMLAKSQRYYHKKYNNANILQMIFLYFTYFITIIISYILAIFKL